MKNRVKFALWLGTAMLVTPMMGCNSLALELPGLGSDPTVPIEVIQARDPLINRDTPIAVTGTVRDRIPIVNGQIYLLADETGEIWVISGQTTAQPGDTVLIEAVVRHETILLAGQDYSEFYLEELSSF